MDPGMTQPAEDQDFSLELMREVLHEVCQATQEYEQSQLFDFSRLLLQLAKSTDVSEGEQSGEHSSRLQFLRDGLREIQEVIAADQQGSDKLNALHQEVIERWGELLTSCDDTDFRSQFQDEDAWGSQTVAEEQGEQDDLVTPSVEEIHSLLGQLNSTQSSSPKFVPERVHEMDQSDLESTTSRSVTDSHSLASMDAKASLDSLDDELREAFLYDASHCVTSMENSLLQLEANPKDPDALNQICRELHTLKGASASVGLSDMADLLHGLEDQLREDHSAGKTPQIDALLASVDLLRSQILSDVPVDTQAEFTAESSDESASAEHRTNASLALPDFGDGISDDEMVRVKSSQLNRLMDMLAELVMLRNRREMELADLQEVYHELICSVSKMRLLSNEGNVFSDACSSLQLTEVANDVLEVAQHVRDCARPVAEGNASVSQFIRQFRQELVALRRTPISGLFRRLQRVVRDAAHAEGKEVDLKLIGEDAGIETSLQQRLYEPLLHIVRNSVCHGIEQPKVREQFGKLPSGKITVEARSGTDMFVIEIGDDGRGLNYDAIRRRGIEAGLLRSEQVASREELSQLIFKPGFSTRQSANQIAGRGYGMDVVASTIQRMRGWLEIDSETNWGTRIRLSFPLPSVIQHAMVFRCGGQLFALPMQSVRSAGESGRESRVLAFAKMLGVAPAENSQRIDLAWDSSSSQDKLDDATRTTLLVDEVVGPEEVVVRPLPSLLKHHPYCSGATLSGMSQTVLFLDARRLIEAQADVDFEIEGGAIQDASTSGQCDWETGDQSQRPRVLVVDDSLSARKRVVRLLGRYPIDIVEASDGKKALAILKQQHFDAIFSDMEMPHVTGMDLLEALQSYEQGEAPPVVIISSRNEAEFTDRAHELGANNYLFKPLGEDALERALVGIPTLCHLESGVTRAQQLNGENHGR